MFLRYYGGDLFLYVIWTETSSKVPLGSRKDWYYDLMFLGNLALAGVVTCFDVL